MNALHFQIFWHIVKNMYSDKLKMEVVIFKFKTLLESKGGNL